MSKKSETVEVPKEFLTEIIAKLEKIEKLIKAGR